MPEAAGKSLLIVDNSILIVERLIGILKEVKAIQKTFTASNYTEAVEVLGSNRIDIILLDIQLPGKNGIELLRFIVKKYPEIKVIMFSNLVSEYYQRLCKKIGASGFIDKSKGFDLIPEMVATI